MPKQTIKLIDGATAHLWKQENIAYLRTLHEVPESLEEELMRVLRPHYKPKGHLLLEEHTQHTEATFLRSGLVKLFLVNSVTNKEQILHIWTPGHIIVLYQLFRERELNQKYFIKVISPAELVSVGIDQMDKIYSNHPAAEILTVDILSDKSVSRIKLLEILGFDKKERYSRFVRLFPELVGLLGNDDLCAFLGVCEATLIESRSDYLRGKDRSHISTGIT